MVLRVTLAAICLMLGTACTTMTASGAKMRPAADSRLRAIQTAGLMSLDVKEYEVSASGAVELKEEWTAKARENVERELIAGLQSRRIEVRQVEPQPDTAEELNDLRLLNEAVSGSLDFPGTEFGYSLGPVGHLLDRYRVDALIFVWARGRLVTEGRKWVAAFAGRGEMDAGQVAITIVDRSGDVLWFNTRGLRGVGADLRYGDSTKSLLRAMISELPPVKP